MWTLILVFFLHYIGDFFFQRREWAERKSEDVVALSKHVFVYSFVLFLGVSMFFDVKAALAFATLNFGIHFLIDYVTSKMAKHYYNAGMMGAFWDTIGVDQLLHSLTLIVTTGWILNGV